ncbi:MAG: PilZ domain-containing protein [Treponema sp.]|nr:PilZ domain-containing protein [Treponema sp.]
MLEKRKNPRYNTLAHVRIPGMMDGENLLKDLSVTSCCVECTTAVDIKPDSVFQLEVIPEADSGIGSFSLSVEFKLIRPTGYSTDIVFAIIASPKGKHFQRYVDYLVWKQAQ